MQVSGLDSKQYIQPHTKHAEEPLCRTHSNGDTGTFLQKTEKTDCPFRESPALSRPMSIYYDQGLQWKTASAKGDTGFEGFVQTGEIPNFLSASSPNLMLHGAHYAQGACRRTASFSLRFAN